MALGAMFFFAHGDAAPIIVISDNLPVVKGDFLLEFPELVKVFGGLDGSF